MKSFIASLESFIKDPTNGLPEEIFLFVSKISPVVNVDLLVKDRRGATLLTWREDGLHPPCWHVPGGVIRFKETAEQRVRAVAALELGTEVRFKKAPVAVNEHIHSTRAVRGHFISLLYRCALVRPPDPERKHDGGEPRPGQWAWHKTCPKNLIAGQEMYRSLIG